MAHPHRLTQTRRSISYPKTCSNVYQQQSTIERVCRSSQNRKHIVPVTTANSIKLCFVRLLIRRKCARTLNNKHRKRPPVVERGPIKCTEIDSSISGSYTGGRVLKSETFIGKRKIKKKKKIKEKKILRNEKKNSGID